MENQENETPKTDHKEEETDESNVEAYLSSFPPGYRFRPLDEELIVDYLLRFINDEPLPENMMHAVNVYDHNPEDLADTYKPQGENEWYFFSLRKYKGKRISRVASDGHWKASGTITEIKYHDELVGHRMTLIFYKRNCRTSWWMHELTINDSSKRRKTTFDEDTSPSMRLDEYVLCRIFKTDGAIGESRSQHEVKEGAKSVQIREAEMSPLIVSRNQTHHSPPGLI